MTPDTLDARILAATERPPLVRARRWHPLIVGLPPLEEWDRDVRATLREIERLERRRAERERQTC